MPSSLVFAALAAAWIVVLVPMVARHRQEVRRTADSALAARVLRRGDPSEHDVAYDSPAESDFDDHRDIHHGDIHRDRNNRDDHRDIHHGDDADVDDDWPEEASDLADDELPERDARYRPGRGGFDPAAAELAARAKYAFRQRVVLFLLLAAVVSAVFALVTMPGLWWTHGMIDATLVGYLAYLRRQVRIEQEVRRRRTERLRARRSRPAVDDLDTANSADVAGSAGSADSADDADVVARRAHERPVHPGALVIDLDDEDPGLWDLEADAAAPYRRAVGE